jgi:hypothetical protein
MKRPEIDIFLVLDVDKDVDEEAGNIDGIAHSFGPNGRKKNHEWDVVCANSVLEQSLGVTA